MDVVASLEFTEERPDGTRVPVRIELGTPRFDDRGSWACPVLMSTLGPKAVEIHGEDSMQALCLAIRFLHQMLRYRIEDGNRLLDARGEYEISLEMYFGPASGG